MARLGNSCTRRRAGRCRARSELLGLPESAAWAYDRQTRDAGGLLANSEDERYAKTAAHARAQSLPPGHGHGVAQDFRVRRRSHLDCDKRRAGLPLRFSPAGVLLEDPGGTLERPPPSSEGWRARQDSNLQPPA